MSKNCEGSKQAAGFFRAAAIAVFSLVSVSGAATVLAAGAVPAAGAAVPSARRWIVTGHAPALLALAERSSRIESATPLARVRRLEHLPIAFVEADEDTIRRLLLAVSGLGLIWERDRPQRFFDAEGNALTEADALLAQGWDGDGEVVAVLDSGIDYNHSQLGGGGFPNSVVIGGYDFGDGDPDPMDELNHGTPVASVITASWGVAPAAKIVALKVSPGASAEAPLSAVLAGLDWVLANRAGLGITIVSMSLGEGLYDHVCDAEQPAYAAATAALARAGVTVFAGAGNRAETTRISAPACVSAAIGVSSVYDIGNLPALHYTNSAGGPLCSDLDPQIDTIPCYASRGVALDLLAPSECSRVALKGGGSHPCFGGTSAATPYGAGAAALLRQAAGGLAPGAVRWRLRQSAPPVPDASGAVYRRLDLAAALAGDGTAAAPGPRTLAAGLASAPGAAAAKTGLAILNGGVFAAAVEFEMTLPGGASSRATWNLLPGSLRLTEDIAAELGAPGALARVSIARPAANLLAAGWVEGTGTRGRVAEADPILAAPAGVGIAEDPLVIAALDLETAGGVVGRDWRFGFLEVSGAACVAEVKLYASGNPTALAAAEVSLAPGEGRELDSLLTSIPSGIELVRAEVSVKSGKGRAAAYGRGFLAGTNDVRLLWATAPLGAAEVRLIPGLARSRGRSLPRTRSELFASAGAGGAVLRLEIVPAEGLAGAPPARTVVLAPRQVWAGRDVLHTLFRKTAGEAMLRIRVEAGGAAVAARRLESAALGVTSSELPLWDPAAATGPEGGISLLPLRGGRERDGLTLSAVGDEAADVAIELHGPAGDLVSSRTVQVAAGGYVVLPDLAAPLGPLPELGWLRLMPLRGRILAALTRRDNAGADSIYWTP